MLRRAFKQLLGCVVKLTIKPILDSNLLPFTFKRTALNVISTPNPNAKLQSIQKKAINQTRFIQCTPLIKKHEKHAIIYSHGGAYVTGSFALYNSLVTHIAKSTGMETFFLDYTLSPEAVYPQAKNELLALYTHLIEDLGYSPQNIFIVGDSAGAGLLVSTVATLITDNAQLPKALVLLSPFLDGTCSQHDEDISHIDYMLTKEALMRDAQIYAGELDASDPFISVNFLPDDILSKMPTTLIQAGTIEILLPEIIQFKAHLEDLKVDVELQIYEDVWHDFQLHTTFLNESMEAINNIAAFIHKQV